MQKHDVSFKEATSVFFDLLSITYDDEEHSVNEDRFIIIGSSTRGRTLFISHTDNNDTIRIISARKATSGERREYEEQF